jgi:hypothetical protein
MGKLRRYCRVMNRTMNGASQQTMPVVMQVGKEPTLCFVALAMTALGDEPSLFFPSQSF